MSLNWARRDGKYLLWVDEGRNTKGFSNYVAFNLSVHQVYMTQMLISSLNQTGCGETSEWFVLVCKYERAQITPSTVLSIIGWFGWGFNGQLNNGEPFKIELVFRPSIYDEIYMLYINVMNLLIYTFKKRGIGKCG